MRERRWHLIVPALCGAVGFAVAATAGSTIVSIIFLSIAAGGVLTCAPLFWSLPTAFLTGVGAAAGIALINSVGNLAGFVSPYVIGALRDAMALAQAACTRSPQCWCSAPAWFSSRPNHSRAAEHV